MLKFLIFELQFLTPLQFYLDVLKHTSFQANLQFYVNKIFLNFNPLGLSHSSKVIPIGSGIVIISLILSIKLLIELSERVNLLTNGFDNDFFLAFSKSILLEFKMQLQMIQIHHQYLKYKYCFHQILRPSSLTLYQTLINFQLHFPTT